MIPVAIASQPQSPTCSKAGRSPSDPEPVEAEDPQAEEQEAEAGQGREEADDRDQDGRVLHSRLLAIAQTDAVPLGCRSPPLAAAGTPYACE